MNKAFEKIVNRFKQLQGCDPLANMFISDVIKVIKSIEKEYNNGWIPCSERLPEEHKLYDITFKNSAGIHSDSAIYNPYLKRWLWDADETELVESEQVYFDMLCKIVDAPTTLHMKCSARMLIPIIDRKLRERGL